MFALTESHVSGQMVTIPSVQTVAWAVLMSQEGVRGDGLCGSAIFFQNMVLGVHWMSSCIVLAMSRLGVLGWHLLGIWDDHTGCHWGHGAEITVVVSNRWVRTTCLLFIKTTCRGSTAVALEARGRQLVPLASHCPQQVLWGWCTIAPGH